MREYRVPGVRVEDLLTEHARALQPGVPVFLGLVSQAAIAARNDELNAQVDLDDQFLCKPLAGSSGPALVRKRGYLKLPSRAGDPALESQLSDRSSDNLSTYLRSMPDQARSASDRARARSSRGTGPAPREQAPAGEAPDGDLLKSVDPKPQRFADWLQFQRTYGDLAPAGFLSYAVRGFFENGGALCYVQLISYGEAGEPRDISGAIATSLEAGLATLAPYDNYDLVCVPDLMWEESIRSDLEQVARLQDVVMAHCAQLGERMAILDAVHGDKISTADVMKQRNLLTEEEGALYYPWVRVPGGPARTGGYVPPCGHVAGVYARTDQHTGVHKAPANEVLEGVVDLAVHLSDEDQGPLNDRGINCLRAFPRRGIRVWGARTLSRETSWRYVNARRVVLTAARWIAFNLSGVAFEPNTERLWARITRDLTAYLEDLARRGALAGPPGEPTFYVKCDAETNPPELRETGRVVTEISLRPAAAAEFIVIRIIHGAAGVKIVDPKSQTT